MDFNKVETALMNATDKEIDEKFAWADEALRKIVKDKRDELKRKAKNKA